MANSNLPGDSSKTVGECIIFNYEVYDKHMNLSLRENSICDAKRLEHVFKELNFNVQPRHDSLTKSGTQNALKEVSKAISKNSKYFVCCILTHGDSTDRLAARDRYLDLEDFTCCFNPTENSDIPRIFIIQACRGDETEKIRKLESTDSIYENEVYSGFVIARSTYPGKYAFKNGHGSYFIQELCNCLECFSKDKDLFEILTVTSYRLANFFRNYSTEHSFYGQMPQFVSTLKSPISFQKYIKPYESNDRKIFDERRAQKRPNRKGEEDPYYDLKTYEINSAESVKFYQILTKKNGPTELEKAAAHLRTKMIEIYRTKTIKSDLKKSKIIEEIESIASDDSNKNSDCVIVFVATPCKGQYFCDNGGRKFSKTNVIETFVQKQLSSFVQKPKVFIFLLCEPKPKMEYTDAPKNEESADGSDGNPESFFTAEHANILDITISIKNPDILPELMKIFVSELTSISEVGPEDLLTKLTRINSMLCEKRDFNLESQDPKKPRNAFSFSSTLTKKLILP